MSSVLSIFGSITQLITLRVRNRLSFTWSPLKGCSHDSRRIRWRDPPDYTIPAGLAAYIAQFPVSLEPRNVAPAGSHRAVEHPQRLRWPSGSRPSHGHSVV